MEQVKDVLVGPIFIGFAFMFVLVLFDAMNKRKAIVIFSLFFLLGVLEVAVKIDNDRHVQAKASESLTQCQQDLAASNTETAKLNAFMDSVTDDQGKIKPCHCPEDVSESEIESSSVSASGTDKVRPELLFGLAGDK